MIFLVRGIKNNGDIEGYNRVTVQEFSFWGIVTSWGYGDIFDLPHGEILNQHNKRS
ncbi:MAG: hypothetical protein Ct9H90mP10_08550 [Actinomycetota bacterium]|nr:MAG: hypothetical protein Ct9H90mP10_08550 [Actinomycetota bacterium]